MIRARTRAALAAKRARRELVGAVPYGFALRGDGVLRLRLRVPSFPMLAKDAAWIKPKTSR